MKRFDMKSLVAGVILGTLGVTTVFAATGIQSAVLSSTQVTLKGASLPLDRSLISVTMENEQNASLYVPANELLEKLGYTVLYDGGKDTIDLIPDDHSSQGVVGSMVSEGNVVMDLANHADQKNIAESGSFQAEDGQTLILTVTSDTKGGEVNLFLFDPDGKEQRITIGAANISKEIALKKGIWQYNCSGLFVDGGNVRVVGVIR